MRSRRLAGLSAGLALLLAGCADPLGDLAEASPLVGECAYVLTTVDRLFEQIEESFADRAAPPGTATPSPSPTPTPTPTPSPSPTRSPSPTPTPSPGPPVTTESPTADLVVPSPGPGPEERIDTDPPEEIITETIEALSIADPTGQVGEEIADYRQQLQDVLDSAQQPLSTAALEDLLGQLEPTGLREVCEL